MHIVWVEQPNPTKRNRATKVYRADSLPATMVSHSIRRGMRRCRPTVTYHIDNDPRVFTTEEPFLHALKSIAKKESPCGMA